MSISLTTDEKAILSSVSIPPRPEVLLKFSEEAKKAEPNISVISNILQSDVAISAAILQVVNSAAFRRCKEIESIDQAIMTLGLKRLVPLVRAVALQSTIGDDPKLSNFWDSQTEIAQFSASIASKLNKTTLSNHAYMLGLFHFVGVPILNQHFAEYSSIIELANQAGWDHAADEEVALFKTSHTTIGALLAQQWGLPKAMIYVIYYLHDTEGIFTSGELDQSGLDLMSILKLARHLQFIKSNPENTDNEWANIVDDVVDHLGCDEEELTELIAE
ncbi:HDOD domain-containing protein [Pseudoalteromonas sp.]|uniref:HDOD domain-containing protein n=1 Tax=Pseudoalteromonas sp. TaxID=53249 RepID=UPI00356AB5C6